MELIRISDGKLKVILTAEDMQHYALAPEEINYENTETRRVIWEILDEAKHKTGFDAASDRIFIQVYPGRRGGCELYITKLGAGECEHARTDIRRSGGIYRFACLAHLLAACDALAAGGYRGESAAYIEEEVSYLILRGGELSHSFSFLEEYGEKLAGRDRLAYIEEYAVPLAATDAVGRLSGLR